MHSDGLDDSNLESEANEDVVKKNKENNSGIDRYCEYLLLASSFSSL